MTDSVYAIIGLGNPGTEYQNNRHNSGFLFLDYLAKNYDFDEFKKKKNFTYSHSKTAFGGKNIYLIKPQTYMNLSGNAITECMSFFKIPKENIVVVYDDISLPFSTIRVRGKGSAGGHNGIKNIIQCLGSQEFARVKIGVSSPKQSPNGEDVLKDYVLGNFSPEQLTLLNNQVFSDVYDAIGYVLDGDLDTAMNKFNKTIKS